MEIPPSSRGRAGRTGKTGGASAARSLIAIDRIDHAPVARNVPINRTSYLRRRALNVARCFSARRPTSLVSSVSRSLRAKSLRVIRGAVRNPIKKARDVMKPRCRLRKHRTLGFVSAHLTRVNSEVTKHRIRYFLRHVSRYQEGDKSRCYICDSVTFVDCKIVPVAIRS